MTENATNTFGNLKRQALRLTIYKIWKMIREDNFDELKPEEQKLSMLIMSHQEYQEYYENEEILDGREFEIPGRFNPFLHISLHQMVEDQLASENPVEAVLLCEYIEKMGHPRHTAIHVIIMIMMNMIADSFRNEGRFNEDRYKRLLVKCRNVKPSEMQDVVEREFSGN